MYSEEKCLLLEQISRRFFEFSVSLTQLFYLVILMFLSITPGMSIGFSAIALPQLNLSLEESTWFASIPTIGTIIGNIIVGFIIDRYGRKLAFLSGTIPSFAGCILLFSSRKLYNLYLGQFFLGISQGAVTLPPSVYIAESLVPDNLKLRSSITSWNVFAINFGIFLVYLLGYMLLYTDVALFGACISLISSILIIIFIPESPAWLYHMGKHTQAETARLRLGVGEDAIKNAFSYQSLEKENSHKTFLSYVSQIKRKDVYRPLCISISYFFFQQFSGAQVFSAYMVNILTVKSVKVDPYLLTAITGVIIIFSQITYTVVLPYFGVRTMTIFSSIMSGLMMLFFSVCLILEKPEVWYSNLMDYIHITLVWVYAFVGGLGMSTTPYIIIAEIFPHDVKGFASIPIFFVSIYYFAVLMIYPFLLVAYNCAVYIGFSVVSFSSVFFLYYCLPETVGKTLYEINRDLVL